MIASYSVDDYVRSTGRAGGNYPEHYVFVPAFGVGRFVADKDQAPAVAREMIAACGAAPRVFDIEISARSEIGRASSLTAGPPPKLRPVR